MKKIYEGLPQTYWQENGPYHLDDEEIPKEQLCSICSGNCDVYKDMLFEKSLSNPPFSDMDIDLYSHIDDLMQPQDQIRHQLYLTKLTKN